jgi:hypothetical protein
MFSPVIELVGFTGIVLQPGICPGVRNYDQGIICTIFNFIG